MLSIGRKVVATIQVSFDVFVFEVFLSLLNGLEVIFANEEEIGNGNSLAKLIEDNGAEVLHATPTKLKMYCMFDAFCKSLSQIKIMMIGAETFTEELYKLLRKYTDAIIYNGYGPAETTIGVSFAEMKEVPVSVSNSTPPPENS